MRRRRQILGIFAWTCVIAGLVLLPALLLCGCVRPQYDTQMGAANLLAADAFDASVSDLASDNAKLRDIKLDAAFAIIETKAAASQPVTLSELEKVHQGVRTDQAERQVIAEIVRKGRAASNAVRMLGQRSQAIGQQEQKFLNSIGVSTGGAQ